jgi:hypothetical protein
VITQSSGARTRLTHPFGQADCESEVKALNGHYNEIYFEATPFNPSRP